MRLTSGTSVRAHRVWSAPCRSLAALMLFALLIQILPFTCGDPLPAGRDDRGISQYIKSLPVCGDEGGPGGLLADHSWLPAPSAQVSGPVLDAGAPPERLLFLPPPPVRRLLRPPRA
jgi:hypothetical protein